MPWNLPTGKASTNAGPISGCDDVLTVRLAMVGSELRQKLVVGNAGGRVEAGHLLNLRADRERDIACQRNLAGEAGQVT